MKRKRQTAKARTIYAEKGGSMIRFLDDAGLLQPRTTLAHCVWLAPSEMGLLAERGVSVAHNPISNMKLKSGVAPMRAIGDAGVNIALGCDNSSCGDCQNMFQAMKAYCLLAAVSDPQPTGVRAADAVHAATLGGARAVGLEGVVGAIRPGLKADLVLIDLRDPAFMPFNSATRQLVFSESGRGVETTIVDGRIVMRDRRMVTVDEGGAGGGARVPHAQLPQGLRRRGGTERGGDSLPSRGKSAFAMRGRWGDALSALVARSGRDHG